MESEGELFGFVPGAAGTGYASTGIVAGAVAAADAAADPRRSQRHGQRPVQSDRQPVETPSRARIFVCRAPDPKEETACASRILSNLARKAFRRPVTDKDLAPLHAVLHGRPEGRHV